MCVCMSGAPWGRKGTRQSQPSFPLADVPGWVRAKLGPFTFGGALWGGPVRGGGDGGGDGTTAASTPLLET